MDSIAKAEQIRAIQVSRFVGYYGRLDKEILGRLEEAIRITLALGQRNSVPIPPHFDYERSIQRTGKCRPSLSKSWSEVTRVACCWMASAAATEST